MCGPGPQATCDNKRGLLPSGLDEEVVVEFCPQQYRYYYDCVRVHSEVRGESCRFGFWGESAPCCAHPACRMPHGVSPQMQMQMQRGMNAMRQ